MGIVEPAAVSMSVIDPKYANAVEACINAIQQLVCRPSSLIEINSDVVLDLRRAVPRGL